MSVQYGNSAMSQQMVSKWVKRFMNGCTIVKHEEGARRLSTSITDANTEQVCDMILQNRLVLLMKWHINWKLVMVQPMKLFATGLPSIKSVHDELQSNTQNCTKTNFWTSANDFWFTVVLKVTNFWERIIMGDETWIHHYEPESKRQCMEWTHPHSPTKKKFKRIQLQESLC